MFLVDVINVLVVVVAATVVVAIGITVDGIVATTFVVVVNPSLFTIKFNLFVLLSFE